MNFLNDVFVTIVTKITRFGKKLRDFESADVVGFYESTEGPNVLVTGGSWETTFCLQEGTEPGFSKCWKARRR